MSFDPFDGPLGPEDVALLYAYEASREDCNNRQQVNNSTNNGSIKKNSGCCGVFLVILIILAICLIA